MAKKQFSDAPFGTQASRFDISGVHPRWKMPGTLTQVAYSSSSSTTGDKQVGTDLARSSEESKKRVPGIDWKRQEETERLANQPHLLYREQWEQNKMLERKLGPGSYEIKDFIQCTQNKPTSNKGVCQTLAPRFHTTQKEISPGPGVYGIDGIPHKALEEKAKKSFGSKGMLEMGGRDAHVTSGGSNLGPGTYNIKSGTEELLRREKGPPKMFSGDRNKPAATGHWAVPKPSHLGPGQYDTRSFVDELNSPHHKLQGCFGKLAQYPEVPTERIILFSKTHNPGSQNSLGPGSYDVKEFPKQKAVNSPGFLSSSRRDDKMSQKFFTRNFNQVGPGRYDIHKMEEARDVNGHTSVFKSRTGPLNKHMYKMLQERISGNSSSVSDFLPTRNSCPVPNRRLLIM